MFVLRSLGANSVSELLGPLPYCQLKPSRGRANGTKSNRRSPLLSSTLMKASMQVFKSLFAAPVMYKFAGPTVPSAIAAHASLAPTNAPSQTFYTATGCFWVHYTVSALFIFPLSTGHTSDNRRKTDTAATDDRVLNTFLGSISTRAED